MQIIHLHPSSPRLTGGSSPFIPLKCKVLPIYYNLLYRMPGAMQGNSQDRGRGWEFTTKSTKRTRNKNHGAGSKPWMSPAPGMVQAVLYGTNPGLEIQDHGFEGFQYRHHSGNIQYQFTIKPVIITTSLATRKSLLPHWERYRPSEPQTEIGCFRTPQSWPRFNMRLERDGVLHFEQVVADDRRFRDLGADDDPRPFAPDGPAAFRILLRQGCPVP